MKHNGFIKRLYAELPHLVAAHVLDSESAERLRAHYGPVPERNPRALALLVFGVIGAGLVGLGIILVLANNWDDLSRPIRAGMVFALLLAAQALAAFAMARRPGSRAWNESTALFLGLCIGAAIALIGQTYNIPGDFDNFLLTWMLLALPLVYLMDAGVVAVGYLAGVTWWATWVQWDHQTALWYWPLAAGSGVYLARTWRREPDSLRTAWLMWAASACLVIGPGVALERALPGVWIPLYVSLFAVMYLCGVFWLDGERGTFRSPFRTVGTIGLAVISLVLTFEDPWRDVGWNHYRRTWGYSSTGAIADYVVTATVFLFAVGLLVTTVRRKRLEHVPFSIAPILALVGFVVAAGTDDAIIPWASFNIYVFVCSLLTIVSAVRAGDLRRLNEGMLFLAGLVLVRFFDDGFSFLARGIAFIVIGLAFLGANFAMAGRKKEAA